MGKEPGKAFLPYVMLIVAVVAVSFSSIFTKLSDAPPLVIATYRLGLAELILMPVALAIGWRELRQLNRHDLALSLGAGAFLALHFMSWISSLKYTSVASSVVLVTIQPIFVVAGSYLFLKERVGYKALLGGGLAVIGAVLIGASDFRVGGRALFGDALALGGAVFVAAYFLIGRRLRQRLSLMPYVFLIYGISSLILALTCLFSRIPLFPYSPRNWLLFLGLALIPTVLGHTIFNWALRYVKASLVSISILGEPIGTIFLAGIFLGEAPTWLQIVGGVLILTGLGLFTVYSGASGGAAENK